MKHVSVLVNHPGQARGALHAKQIRENSLWMVHSLHIVLLGSELNND